jgi:carboxylate-amine ligase
MYQNNTPVKTYPRFLINQNRWRSMRYGYDEGLVDFASARIMNIEEWLPKLVDMIREDARELGCENELNQILTIPGKGTSAHKQIATYNAAIRSGKDNRQALCEVVDELIEGGIKS